MNSRALVWTVWDQEEEPVLGQDEGEAAVSAASRGQTGQIQDFFTLHYGHTVTLQRHHLVRCWVCISTHHQISFHRQHQVLLLPLFEHEATLEKTQKHTGPHLRNERTTEIWAYGRFYAKLGIYQYGRERWLRSNLTSGLSSCTQVFESAWTCVQHREFQRIV